MTRTRTALPPTGLLCELLEQPERTRIRNPRPRFGWVVNDLAPDAHQVACQILVASGLEVLARDEGDLWDSGEPSPGAGWQTNGDSLHVPYDGRTLESHATYCWKVRTWNQRNQPSRWSEPQVFHTGELTEAYTTAGYPLEEHTVEPVAVVDLGEGRTFVDFGRAAFGTVELTLTSPKSGAVEVHLGEVLDGVHTIDRAPGGSRRYRVMTLAVEAGTHTYRVAVTPDEQNTKTKRPDGQPGAVLMPAEAGEVMPFRYAEIVGACAPIRRADVRQIAVTYRFNDAAARFASASRVLNDVWEMCRYTMKATSFCGLYVDGDRERIPYEADAYVNQLGHYGCDREFTLARRTHEYLIDHPNWPTEWPLCSVLVAWADYEYTGDPASLSRYYTDLEAKSLVGLARDDGLVSVQDNPPSPELLAALHCVPHMKLKDIVDWPQCERDDYDMSVSVNTVVNAFHYRAVVLMGRIAGALGKVEAAAEWTARAERVKAAMHALVVDRTRGLFVDGEGSTHASLHGNLFPLAFGLVPPELKASVLAFIQSKGMACSVYASQFLLDGLYEAGAADYAFSLLTSRAERSWAHMVYDVGTTIALEAWDDRFKPNQDWNHAWGAAPASIVPRWLVGVRPLEPGFGRILVHPQPGPLAYAEAIVPTIRGPVGVCVNNAPGRSFHVEVDIPANTNARIVLPSLGRPDTEVIVDGRPVHAVAEADTLVVDPIGSGRHSLVRM